MNTPSHLILNLAVLRRPLRPATWPILLGALVPDAAMFVFYAWARWSAQLPERTIWNDAFYRPFWQDIFAVGNSVPLALLGLGVSWRFKQPVVALFFASMVLHHALDLPLHNEDAHRHFWPLSDLRVISPVSYWDAEHFGWLGAGLEVGLVLAASAYLWQRLRSPWGRGLIVLTNLLYGLLYLRFYVWG